MYFGVSEALTPNGKKNVVKSRLPEYYYRLSLARDVEGILPWSVFLS